MIFYIVHKNVHFIRNKLVSNKNSDLNVRFLFDFPRIYSIIVSKIRRLTKEGSKRFGKENGKTFPDNFT